VLEVFKDAVKDFIYVAFVLKDCIKYGLGEDVLDYEVYGVLV